MKRPNSMFSFNHINPNLSESEISELKALYKFYHKKYWLFKMTFKKAELACHIGSAVLVVTGTVVGGVTVNPIVLETIFVVGLLLTTLSEAKNDKKRSKCVNLHTLPTKKY